MEDIFGKTVVLRVDFNVPIDDGKITDTTRIDASIPTINKLMDQGNKIVILSHLGRPTEGVYDEKLSLRPVAEYLNRELADVTFYQDWLDSVTDIAKLFHDYSIVVCENVRFCVGETSCDLDLAKKMASLGDVFVMDAFGTCHRDHASTTGIANFIPRYYGILMKKEIDALIKVMENPARPLVAVVGGSKVSSKLTILENLVDKVDHLIVGGGIANTFLLAQGKNVGKSLVEKDLIESTNSILKSGKVIVPIDVVLAKEFSPNSPFNVVNVDDIKEEEDGMILDYGPRSAMNVNSILVNAKTILWNGPVGVFEMDSFSNGTKMLTESINLSDAYSVAGGGDTIAAINKFGTSDTVSYISTGGGAFLEFIEGKIKLR